MGKSKQIVKYASRDNKMVEMWFMKFGRSKQLETICFENWFAAKDSHVSFRM